MTCTTQFWEFFKPVAEATPGITTVMQSGGDKMDRLLAITRSEDIYPACFLSRPKYSLEDNGAGATIAWFDATFYLILTAEMMNTDDEDLAFNEAERLATDICAKIRMHEDNYTVLIDPMAKVYMEPITMITLEASYGYEARFRIGLLVNSTVYANV